MVHFQFTLKKITFSSVNSFFPSFLASSFSALPSFSIHFSKKGVFPSLFFSVFPSFTLFSPSASYSFFYFFSLLYVFVQEGVKELLSYLDGSGGVSLCPLLDRQSANFSHFDKLLCKFRNVTPREVSCSIYNSSYTEYNFT